MGSSTANHAEKASPKVLSATEHRGKCFGPTAANHAAKYFPENDSATAHT